MNIFFLGGGGVERVGWDRGMMKLNIFRGPSQNWTIFGSFFLNILCFFLKFKIQNWNIFGGC